MLLLYGGREGATARARLLSPQAACAALQDMLGSHDLQDIREALADYKACASPPVRAAWRRLQQHLGSEISAADERLCAMRQRMESLVGRGSVMQARAAIRECEAAGLTAQLLAERESLEAHVGAMLETARVALQDMLTCEDLADVEEALSDYAELAQQDVREAWVALSQRRDSLLEQYRRRLRALGQGRDLAALTQALTQLEQGPSGCGTATAPKLPAAGLSSSNAEGEGKGDEKTKCTHSRTCIAVHAVTWAGGWRVYCTRGTPADSSGGPSHDVWPAAASSAEKK